MASDRPGHSEYFKLITEGRFVRLLVDDDGTEPVLMAQQAQAKVVGIAALSEGTGDQLHLAPASRGNCPANSCAIGPEGPAIARLKLIH